MIEEVEGFFEDAVGRVDFCAVCVGEDFSLGLAGVSGDGVLIDGVDRKVIVEEGGVKGMSVALTIVAVEAVEALGHGRAGGIGGAESPFSESTRDVAGRLENLRDGDGFVAYGPLAGEGAAVV